MTKCVWPEMSRVTQMQKKGRFSKVFRLVGTFAIYITQACTVATTMLPSLLKEATAYVLIDKNESIALIDTGIFGYFISLEYTKRHLIK